MSTVTLTENKTTADCSSLSNSEYNLIQDLIDTCVVQIVHQIIKRRKQLSYTQKDVANKTGMKQSAIARIESLSVIPSLSAVIKISHALDLKIILDDKNR